MIPRDAQPPPLQAAAVVPGPQVSSASQPELSHTLTMDEDLLTLVVSTPQLTNAKEITLDVLPATVLIAAPGCAPLRITLPCRVDATNVKAKYDRAARVLRVKLRAVPASILR